MLKSQDIVVIGKLVSIQTNDYSQAKIAIDLGMSPSEVNAGIKRLLKSGLLRRVGKRYKVVVTAIEEFLIHGVKYVFPAERGEPTRGIPTSYAAPPLVGQIQTTDDLPPVWPDPNGTQRGYSLTPLHRSVTKAVVQDPELHKFLALIDGLRDGRMRDKKLAEKELSKLLRK